jgi:hypothetical protein
MYIGDTLNNIIIFQTDTNLMSRPDLNAVNGRVLHHNNELTNFVSRLTEEKIELRKTLGRLEEDVWRYRQKETAVQVRVHIYFYYEIHLKYCQDTDVYR